MPTFDSHGQAVTGPRARLGPVARSLDVMGAGIGGRARRVLVVLTLALGVLAMHGLAGGHHAGVPALPSLTAAAATVAQHPAEAAHIAGRAAHDVLSAGVASPTALHDLAGGCGADCSEHPSGLLLLCAAVLLAASGALVLGLARRTWRTVPETSPPQGTSPRRTAPPRRVDLVADLCISRT